MQQFKIRQDGYSEIKRQSLKKSVPVILIAVIVGVGIPFTTVTSDHFDLNTIFIIVAIVSLSVAWGIKRGLNRIKNLFESYTLIITDNIVFREQANTPTVSLYFNEIKDILILENGSFIIKGEDRSNTITIPAQVENYKVLESTLSGIRPVLEDKGITDKARILSIIIVMVLMISVYTINNKIVVGLSGGLLVIILLRSFYKIRKSKNVDTKTKFNTWWVLIVIVSVLMVMFDKLFN